MNDDRRLMLSLKPRFADAILDGSKTVELRRTRPLVKIPTDALIYASSPTMAIIGRCRVDSIGSYAPTALWEAHGDSAGVTRREFRDYFNGADRAYALMLSGPSRFDESMQLADIRRWWPGFVAPQSFRYLPVVGEPGFSKINEVFAA